LADLERIDPVVFLPGVNNVEQSFGKDDTDIKNIYALLTNQRGLYYGGTAPTSPNTGDKWHDSSAGYVKQWNGSAWVAAEFISGASVINTPAGNIAATTVQDAINELDTEKLGVAAQAVDTAKVAGKEVDLTDIADQNILIYNEDEDKFIAGEIPQSTNGNYYGDGLDGSKTFAGTIYLGQLKILKYAVSSNTVTITHDGKITLTTGDWVSIQQCTLTAINNTAPATTGAFSAGTHYHSITVTSSTTFTFTKTTSDVLETDEISGDATVCKWDGPAIIKNYVDLTIDSGAVVTAAARCKGLLIYCTGNATINGTLTMTARGASAAGAVCDITRLIANNISATETTSQTYAIPAAGSAGGAGSNSSWSQNDGVAGTNGGTGGGGGGLLHPSGTLSGAGTAGTSYSGGTGGGGAYIGTGGNGTANGGAGGNGTDSTAGGGAGNPGGNYGNAQNGTGGLIVMFVKGNLTIGASGLISSDGSNGGSSTNSSGGGSGGGSISVFYGGTLSNSGTVRANGGAGGTTSSYRGGEGGAGTTRLVKIAA
jgi:hypothetical protein